MSDAPERLVTSKCGKMIVSAGMKMFDTDVEYIRAELYEAERAENERLRDIVDYSLQDESLNRLTPRVVDIAYSAFMAAKNPNGENGGASDWLNDTKPMVMKAIAALRMIALETKGTQDG